MTPEERYLIVSNLKKSKREDDVTTFKKYAEGEIEIPDAKYLWKVHNRVDFDEYSKISNEAFKEWLDSLGWKRYYE